MHHDIHTAIGPKAHLGGFAVPIDWIDAIHHPTYPSVVLEAFPMYMIRTTLPNVEGWTTMTATSFLSAGALLAQTRISHWKRPQPRRHHGPRERLMTIVVCQACPINLSFSPSSHSCASGISRTAPKRTLASARSSLQRSISFDFPATSFWLKQDNAPAPTQVCRYHIIAVQSSHRHYPPSSKDNEVLPSRHSDTDLSRLDRSRNSGHDPGYVYVDKFSRDDHMKVDSSYTSRDPYEEPVRPQDLVNRTSSHNDAMSRGPIPPAPHLRSRESMNAVPATPIVPASTTVEETHRRSRDRSPRHHHESRQMSKQPSLALLSLSTTQSGPPQDMQVVEGHRNRGRRINRDREVCTIISGKTSWFDTLFYSFRTTLPLCRDTRLTQWL